MARPKKTEPRLVLHKQSGKAEAIWWDVNGEKCRKMLPGAFGSAESNAAFGRLLVEVPMQTRGEALRPDERRVILADLLLKFLDHAERRYRLPSGEPTSSLTEFKLVARAAGELYGETFAAEFTPTRFKAIRQRWVDEELARSEVNRRARLLRQIFRWGVSEELVPVAVLHALETVPAIERGRTAARETEPIGPVADAHVDATLPYLSRVLQGLIQFARFTGCRPGEACALRTGDIDRTGDVWLYRPEHHKTAHKGKPRVIAVGPKAQAVLAPFLRDDDPQAHLFSPAVAVAELRAAQRAARTTPRTPSGERRVKNPKRQPAEKYTAHAVTVAIGRAVERANAARVKADANADLIPVWGANQLRHTHATEVRRLFGLEGAQVALGHARADVTQVYAERDAALAVKIASAVG